MRSRPLARRWPRTCFCTLGTVVATLVAPPREFFGRLREDAVALWPVLFALVLVMLLGVILGGVYGATEKRWPGAPDWLRGLAFSALPFVLSMLVLVPTIVRSDTASPLWLLAVVSEAVRWAFYGVLLGLVYPVFRARRAKEVERTAAAF